MVIYPHFLVDVLALKGQDLPWHIPPNMEEVIAPTFALFQHGAGEKEKHGQSKGWDKDALTTVHIVPLPQCEGGVESRTGRGRSKGGPGRGKMAPDQARCQLCRERRENIRDAKKLLIPDFIFLVLYFNTT